MNSRNVAQTWNSDGAARYAAGDLAGAIEHFSAAIASDPALSEAYNNRGFVKQVQGDLEGATADFDEAIKLNPRLCSAHINRGNVRQARGDLQGALANFDVALNLNPADTSAFNNRGAVRQALGDLEGAMADFNAAVQFNPRFAEAYNNRGRLRYVQFDLDGAHADLDEALRNNPAAHTKAYVLNNRGGARLLQGNYTGALSDFDEALKIDPRFCAAKLGRANAYYHIGDVERSNIDYTAAYRLDPARAVSDMAQVLAAQAKHDAAGVFADCERHLKENPADGLTYGRRGSTLYYLGREAEGAKDVEMRVRFLPEGKEFLPPLVEEMKRLRKQHGAGRSTQIACNAGHSGDVPAG